MIETRGKWIVDCGNLTLRVKSGLDGGGLSEASSESSSSSLSEPIWNLGVDVGVMRALGRDPRL